MNFLVHTVIVSSMLVTDPQAATKKKENIRSGYRSTLQREGCKDVLNK